MKSFSPIKVSYFRAEVFGLLLFLSAFSAFSQQKSPVVIGSEQRIQSKILGEERRYLVNLPASYEKDDFYIDKKYPVLIVLDGDTHFHAASGIVRFMGGGEQIPEMIVVAVANTNRTRDFTPNGAENFSRFIETELLPEIDKNYRTLPFRALVGHSLGGLFAVDSFLGRKIFNAYLAIDPTLTWDDAAALQKARKALSGDQSFKAPLFLAQADNPFNKGANSGVRGQTFQTFNELLTNRKNVRYKYRFYETEDHFSVPLPSLYDGLLFVFDGYKFPLDTLANKTAADVRRHYEELFRRLGVDLAPPGKLLNGAALFLLRSEKKLDRALEILELNCRYYPQTYLTHQSLGEAYRAKGDKEKALASYKKSLEINPADETAKKAIRELSQN